MKFKIHCFIIILFLINACTTTNNITVVYNAKVYTVNNNFDTAQAFAMQDGKFIAIGSSKEIVEKYPNAKQINANGKYIYPGIIDAHCHFTGYAMEKDALELYDTKSMSDVIAAVKKYATTHNTGWIIGRGWDQNQWTNKNFPTNDSLNILFPNQPVMLDRIDGHAALCNAKALELAGITNTTTIFGGEIIKQNNKITGVLLDNAMMPVDKVKPILSKPKAIEAFVNTQAQCFENGLTSVVDCGVQNYIVDWVQEAQNNNNLQLRIALMLTDDSTNYARFLNQQPLQTNKLHVIGYKVYADGALGSRGAYLLKDYTDYAHHRGLLLKPLDSIKNIANKLVNTNYQMCTHAIGDAGNREILKIYASVLKTKNNKRWRIEHAQVVDTADVKYFGQYNIIPSIQPTHATSDMAWAKDRLGAIRVQMAYAYKNLIAQNGWAPFGTDFPVEYINPFYTFYSAVFRNNSTGSLAQGWQMQNAIARQDALRGITIWAAKGSFEENIKGSIELGKMADFIIADTDLMLAQPMQCRNTKVLQTFIGGEKVWEGKKE